ncbi:MAG TPA: MFS transporter [Anaeromyxobacteraceae bacterium]|nr:MFS transporter [Anaeromyxobacteraceae bacterium]
MDASSASTRAADLRLISLLGFAHGISHLFHLVLPSLFPWLMADFGLSFTRAGTLTAAFFLVSGVGQAVAGFAVDRYGARLALGAGLALFVLSALVLGLARDYPMLLAAALLAGAGNSVFHPADFTVLNRRVSPARLGHAFSAHGLSGNLGWAAGPVLMAGIAAGAGWRAAAFAAGVLALLAFSAVALLRGIVTGPAPAPGREAAAAAHRGSRFAFLGAGAVWMCFLFFLASSMGFGALQNFAPSVLAGVYGLSLGASASALTFYMLGGAAGIAAGGFLAARVRAHERAVAALLVSAALLALALASGAVPPAAVSLLMALVGLCTGTATPSRDLLVRRAAMERFGQHSFGRIYGFVYSGLDVGLSTAPILFGRLMDRGLFQAVLCGVALFQGLAVLAVLRVGRSRLAGAAAERPASPA